MLAGAMTLAGGDDREAEEVTIAVCVPDRVPSGAIHAADHRRAGRVGSLCARARLPARCTSGQWFIIK